jgi:hypothetical protein
MANTNDTSGTNAFDPRTTERLNVDASFEIARAGDNMAWITRKAPYYDVKGPVWNNPDPVYLKPGQEPPQNIKDLGDKKVDYRPDAVIQIGVEPLPRSSMGLLNNDNVRAVYDQALQKKAVDDLNHYGKTPQQMLEHAVNTKYFESPSHMAWSEAASARTGGKITPEQWRRLDPLGGTNGNGPDIVAGGKYPHELSKIGMAHDTDWSLGRYFNAGPMEKLYEMKATTKEQLKDIGGYGLIVGRSSMGAPPKGYYDNGHPDWSVVYLPGPDRKLKASQDDGTAIAAAPSVDNGASARLANANLADAKLTIGDGAGFDRLDITGDKQKGLGNIAFADASSQANSNLKVADDLRWNGDRTSLDFTFNIDKPKPGLGESLQNMIDSRHLSIGDRQIDNPYADSIKKIMDGVQLPEFTPQKNLDNAAALVAAWNGRLGEEIVAGHGKNGHIFLADGTGDSAKMVSVNVKDTDGAAQKLIDTVIAKAQETAPAQPQTAPAQEPEQRKPSSPSLA